MVTLREFIRALNYVFGHRIDPEEIFAEFATDYDWTRDYHLIARLVSEGHDLSDYRQAYKVFEAMSIPHAIDTFYATSKEETGITMDELADFMDAYFNTVDGNVDWL